MSLVGILSVVVGIMSDLVGILASLVGKMNSLVGIVKKYHKSKGLIPFNQKKKRA